MNRLLLLLACVLLATSHAGPTADEPRFEQETGSDFFVQWTEREAPVLGDTALESSLDYLKQVRAIRLRDERLLVRHTPAAERDETFVPDRVSPGGELVLREPRIQQKSGAWTLTLQRRPKAELRFASGRQSDP